MKYSRNFIITFSMLIFAFSSSLATAKGSEIKFSSFVSAIVQTDVKEGTITVSIHDVEIDVIINGDTEIEESGEEVGIAVISVGDFVGITAFFSDAGIIADEIKVLDERSEQFRLRGLITATDTLEDSTVITLLGVDVNIDSFTDITRRGSGSGNSVAPADLMVGDKVNVRGGSQDGMLLAQRIHVGSREQGKIELEGVITILTDAGFTLEIDGGGSTNIIIDSDTVVSGVLVDGAFVEVEGQLNTDLAVVAAEVVVDVDGDGDADDDNKRGKSHGKGNGKGNGNGNGNDDDDDDSDDDGSDSIEVGAEIKLESDSTEVSGKAETEFKDSNGEVEQEFEVELEHADPGTVFTIVVSFGDNTVEFGSITANNRGIAEVKYRSGDDDPAQDLTALLPEGNDVRDITKVQILIDSDVVLEGDFLE